jgi:hypothetical protein
MRDNEEFSVRKGTENKRENTTMIKKWNYLGASENSCHYICSLTGNFLCVRFSTEQVKSSQW